MYPHARCLINHDGGVASVGGCVIELQCSLGGRLKIVSGVKPAIVLFHDLKAGMRVRQIELSTGPKNFCDRSRPTIQVRQPADRAPGSKDQVEGTGNELRSLLHSTLDELGREASLAGKAPRRLQCLMRKIEPKRGGSTANQTQCVATDVTLEMENLLAGYIAQLCGLDVMEGVFAGS